MTINELSTISSIVEKTGETSVSKYFKNIFFTTNFVKKILESIDDSNKNKIIKNRRKAFDRLQKYNKNKFFENNYETIKLNLVDFNIKSNKLDNEKFDLIYTKELDNGKNDELKKYIDYFLDNDLGKKLLYFIFSKQGDIDFINNTLKYNKEIINNDVYKENIDFYSELLQNENIKKFYNTFSEGIKKIDYMEENFELKINYEVQPSDSYLKIEEFLKKNKFDFSGNLNKQDIKEEGLNEGQKSSWNRHLVDSEKKLLDNENLEKLQKITKLYLSFVDEIGKDKKIQERLMKEIDLDSRLKDIYFSDLNENSIIRIDATAGDNNAIYELDDFPRGIAATYLLDLNSKGESQWTSQISKYLENPEKETFVFLIHDKASGACKHEHIEMARLLKEKDGINTNFITSGNWEEKIEKKDGKYFLDGKEVKGVWQHLMVTKEAGDILPELYESGVSILPNYHVSSHKGVQAILWEKYKNKELDEEFLPLIKDGFFAESVKIEKSSEEFSFQNKKYNNLLDFFDDEENKKNNFKNLVLKVVGAENAEGVTVFATLSKKQIKSKIKELIFFINKGLKDGETILLQENKPHTVKEEIVYNSKTNNYESFEGNSINRIFLDGTGKIVSGISQVTKASKIEKNEGEQNGYGTAHGMTDMIIDSI